MGQSQFYDGSVALVWNLTTGIVITQYHVVLNDNFKKVPYMEDGTITPNWEDLVKYSSETSTAEDFNLADTWLNGPPRSVVEKDQI